MGLVGLGHRRSEQGLKFLREANKTILLMPAFEMDTVDDSKFKDSGLHALVKSKSLSNLLGKILLMALELLYFLIS